MNENVQQDRDIGTDSGNEKSIQEIQYSKEYYHCVSRVKGRRGAQRNADWREETAGQDYPLSALTREIREERRNYNTPKSTASPEGKKRNESRKRTAGQDRITNLYLLVALSPVSIGRRAKGRSRGTS